MNGDRHIGTCFVGGENLSAAVIAAGHALDCERYSGGRYKHLETQVAKSRFKRASYC
jgi:endonuclease YncB( thermonuclease family)